MKMMVTAITKDLYEKIFMESEIYNDSVIIMINI